MRVRTGHVDLEENTHVNQLFENAAALRCAWVTGTGGDLYENLAEVAAEHGYTFGVLEDDGTWVAVRSDFVEDDKLKNNSGTLKFRNVVVGDVVLGTARGDFETEAELEHVDDDNSKVLNITRYRVSPLRS